MKQLDKSTNVYKYGIVCSMTGDFEQLIIETEGASSIADSVFNVLTSESAAAAVVHLEKPDSPPESERLDFYNSRVMLGINPKDIPILWELENRPNLSDIVTFGQIKARAQDAWDSLRLQGKIIEPESIGSTDELPIPHHDFSGIGFGNDGNPVCRVAVLSYNNHVPAELRSVRGPLTAHETDNVFSLRRRIEALAIHQKTERIDFSDMPEGIVVEPYDLIIIPSLPFSALHAVMASAPQRNALLYDLRVTQELDI